MTSINYQPTNMEISETFTSDCKNENIQKLFNENIYGALEDAMSIKTDDMNSDDFKNLVLFILNFKCQLI
tara:strand:- start:1806 stop:2015 length:210 start_codon:yes stop_codon:yes gene_type:complete